MITKSRKPGRGVFYTRDSGGKAEMTPRQYILWAQVVSKELGFNFCGTVEQIEAMIDEDRSVEGDIFLDYEVEGDQLSRPGLNALLELTKRDQGISHVMCPRRDRLARPRNPIDGLKIEDEFRDRGIFLVYINKTLEPYLPGERRKIEEQIVGLIDFDNADQENWKLSDKILKAQLSLADAGFSTGGRAPDGFERWLVRADGTAVRKLLNGERVRLKGHHVLWLPTNQDRLEIGLRILDMLERLPASRVAAILTAEGIPSPDAGRCRKDHGTRHLVSGVWHATTVINIARNPLLVACKTYGRRSMGKLFRFTPDGPRLLSEGDYRQDDKRKIVQNQTLISAPAQFAPVVEADRYRRLLAILDERATSQKGKPRSRDPNNNPLGTRVYDMNCCWPMYRTPCGESFEFKCGLYMQSHGQRCNSNRVPGPTATHFALACIRQQLLPPTLRAKIEKRLHEFAACELPVKKPPQSTPAQKAALAAVVADLEAAKRLQNLSHDESQRKVMDAMLNELKQRHDVLQAEIAVSNGSVAAAIDVEAEVAKALSLLSHVDKLASDPQNLAAVTELFRSLNVRLFVKFEAIRPKKRVVNCIRGGTITFGSHPAPIDIYSGPTARSHLKDSPAAVDAADRDGDDRHPGHFETGREGKSIGNVSRGDWSFTVPKVMFTAADLKAA